MLTFYFYSKLTLKLAYYLPSFDSTCACVQLFFFSPKLEATQAQPMDANASRSDVCSIKNYHWNDNFSLVCGNRSRRRPVDKFIHPNEHRLRELHARTELRARRAWPCRRWTRTAASEHFAMIELSRIHLSNIGIQVSSWADLCADLHHVVLRLWPFGGRISSAASGIIRRYTYHTLQFLLNTRPICTTHFCCHHIRDCWSLHLLLIALSHHRITIDVTGCLLHASMISLNHICPFLIGYFVSSPCRCIYVTLIAAILHYYRYFICASMLISASGKKKRSAVSFCVSLRS